MNQMHEKFGKVLQLERERKNLKLENISEELKISTDNLKAIENGDSSKIPTELYYTLFSKSYAERLGVDYNRTIEAIKQDIEQEVSPTDQKNSDQESTAFDNNDDFIQSDKKDNKDKSSDSEKPAPSFGKKLLMTMGAVVVISIILLGTYKLFFDTENSIVTDQSSDVSNSTNKINEVSDEAKYASFDWSKTEYPKYETIKLSLKAREESWATVIADGDTVIYRSLIPNRDYNVTAKYRILVSIGIPSRVDAKLNNQQVNLRNPETRRISRLEINQINLDDIIEGTFYNVPPKEIKTPTAKQSTIVSPAEKDTVKTNTNSNE